MALTDEIVEIKLNNKEITANWYKEEFLDPKKVTMDNIIINFGLNKKTISNMYNTARKEIALTIRLTSLKTSLIYLIKNVGN